MSGLRAGDITARLLSAPHRVRPEWLTGDKDAVPFAAAGPIAPVVAGRLAAAARASGEGTVLGCPVLRSRAAERAVAVQAEGARIHAALQAMGTPETLVVLPDLSAALVATGAGFAIAAGPRPFVETVAGADVRRARSGFAEFALALRMSSPQPLAAAAYYGCPLSGRPWRPAWRAWRTAAQVPYGTGVSGQITAMRQLADGRIGAAEFARVFRAARRQEMDAGERAAGPLSAALETIWWALDGYVAAGDGWPRAPGDIDLARLRAMVSAALAEITGS